MKGFRYSIFIYHQIYHFVRFFFFGYKNNNIVGRAKNRSQLFFDKYLIIGTKRAILLRSFHKIMTIIRSSLIIDAKTVKLFFRTNKNGRIVAKVDFGLYFMYRILRNTELYNMYASSSFEACLQCIYLNIYTNITY